VDSESYSDFEPSQAPHWSVRVKMVEKPACLLSEYLTEFIHLCNSNRSMQDLLGGLVDRKNLGKNSCCIVVIRSIGVVLFWGERINCFCFVI